MDFNDRSWFDQDMNFPNTPEGVAGLYAKFIGDCQHGRNIPGQFTSVLA